MTDKLTFKELNQGDKFIAFPLSGDDAGHGGYKGGHVLFYKHIKKNVSDYNAKSFTQDRYCHFPDSMLVLKIV